MLKDALALAELDWPVFPLNGKLPRIPKAQGGRGFKDGTTDPDTIREWWDRWPDANIGLAIPAGVIVVDIDPRHGGNDTWNRMLAGRPEPATMTVRTGGPVGGRHLYFRHPGGTLKHFPRDAGIDLREGGESYVVCPPSVHPDTGAEYVWETSAPVAECPPWLADVLHAPEPAKPAERAPRPAADPFASPIPDPFGPSHGAGDGLVRHVAGLAPGNRNNGLYWAACRAQEDGILDELEGNLAAAARTIGLPDHEITKAIRSARDNVPAGTRLYGPDSLAGPTTGRVTRSVGQAVTGEPDAAAGDEDGRTVFDLLVERETDRLRVQRAAREKLEAEQASRVTIPAVWNLADFLDQPDDPIVYRVDGLWPAGGRVVLAAPNKAGKSTFVGNLLRSLADGDQFLDQFDTERATRVVLLDDELDPRTLRRWLRDQGIATPAAVHLVSLKGILSNFDILTPAVRSLWAQALGAADVLILDCLRPVLDALGLDENHEAGRFLVAFDELLTEAGIPEALVVHHTGHGGDRSRGDSRILDWPDAVWSIVRDDPDESGSMGQASRYFRAYGRDVDQPQVLLGFDDLTRRLSVAGGSRADVRTDAALEAVVALLAKSDEPLSVRKILDGLAAGEHPQRAVREAIKRGVRLGMVLTEDGPRRSLLHFLNPSVSVCRSVSPVRQHTGGECVSVSIEDTLTPLIPAQSSVSGESGSEEATA